jgi:GTPase SAR1 family protein
MPENFKIKIALIGDYGSGKSTFYKKVLELFAPEAKLVSTHAILRSGCVCRVSHRRLHLVDEHRLSLSVLGLQPEDTEECDFTEFEMSVDSNSRVRVSLWDTAGTS